MVIFCFTSCCLHVYRLRYQNLLPLVLSLSICLFVFPAAIVHMYINLVFLLRTVSFTLFQISRFSSKTNTFVYSLRFCSLSLSLFPLKIQHSILSHIYSCGMYVCIHIYIILGIGYDRKIVCASNQC